MLVGADVSEYQGRPDYARWRAATGARFAIARTAFGLDYLDKSYPYNRDAIPAAGLTAGAYHFLRSKPDASGDSARRQADLFLRLAPEHALHALDVEYLHDVSTYGVRLNVAAFLAEYRAHYPHHPLVIYTGRDLWAQTAPPALRGSGNTCGPLWSAGPVPNWYQPGPASLTAQAGKLGSQRSGTPYGGWASPVMIQVSDECADPGISGGYDGDVFLGSDADLAALTGSSTPPPPTPTGATVYGPVRKGDTDAATHGSVSVVQRAAGHGTIVDGIFGNNTVIGVENFQARHSLTADGIVGPATAGAMSLRYIPR